ncbi:MULTISPECIES: helix-turn-helix domain-containing protein [Actinoplanes]|uniref:PucR family transcriptional regulator n=1 Tax=Actinoplanes TaxID=1865 RepID=UPI001FDFBB59|nr:MULTISPECIES: helix-turn-helix domain-containing protein [Actinoplanes]
MSEVSGLAIAAITEEVPAYAEAFAGELGPKIERAVRAALATFLNLVSRPGADPGSPLSSALEAAYALGRGEARSGRSLDALLAAYRVGARVAWRELARTSVGTGQSAETIADFAELVFAYIDELSAASVAGHADEVAASGRVRQRRLQELTQALISGEAAHVVQGAAEQAEWTPPQSLTAILLPERAARWVIDLLDRRTLHLADAVPELPGMTVLLVPDPQGTSRPHLTRLLAGHSAIVGPARPWLEAQGSVDRVLRVRRLIPATESGRVIDTEDHLAAVVVTADTGALADLRAWALAPLDGERGAAAAKLIETLRSWLLHQGRREDVAAELFVHPQTVRYRMARLRELYGEKLKDPQWVMALTIALAVPADT